MRRATVLIVTAGFLLCESAFAATAIREAQPAPRSQLEWKLWQKKPGFRADETIPWASVRYAMARAEGRKTASVAVGGLEFSKAAAENLLLYRCAADNPAKISVQGVQDSLASEPLRTLLKTYARGPQGRPLAWVAYLNSDDADHFSQARWILPPAVLALTVAGYDVRVSLRGEINPTAVVLYLVAPGGSALPSAWKKALDPEKNSAQIVFLQTWGALPLDEPWRSVRAALGISLERRIPGGQRLPALSRFRRQRLAYAADWTPLQMQSTDLALTEISGLSLLTIPEEGRPVLMAERANRYFINGNTLHGDVAYVLDQILEKTPVLSRPAPVLLFPGVRSVIFALDDADLDLALPGQGRQVRVLLRSAEHGVADENVLDYRDRLRVRLKRFEFMVAERLELAPKEKVF